MRLDVQLELHAGEGDGLGGLVELDEADGEVAAVRAGGGVLRLPDGVPQEDLGGQEVAAADEDAAEGGEGLGGRRLDLGRVGEAGLGREDGVAAALDVRRGLGRKVCQEPEGAAQALLGRRGLAGAGVDDGAVRQVPGEVEGRARALARDGALTHAAMFSSVSQTSVPRRTSSRYCARGGGRRA